MKWESEREQKSCWSIIYKQFFPDYDIYILEQKCFILTNIYLILH